MNIVPFKTKMVEAIRLLSREERVKKIERAWYNMFFLSSEDVYIDLLTDSGTGAMSEKQWASLMCGDESYAGSTSFRKFRYSVEKILGFPYVIPTHQGRGAEQVLNRVLVESGMTVPGNAHFDTTRAHIEERGGIPIDCTVNEVYEDSSQYLFKGNMSLITLKRALNQNLRKIAYILLTITCNQAGGQPVSLENIQSVSDLAKLHGVQLFFDGARFAENAFFIKEREEGFKSASIRSIVLKMMSYADGMLMSAKKDSIVNIGGFIALRDKALLEKLSPYAILMEGFLHYGGMAGRDMEALAQGLFEGTDEDYLRYRISQVKYLGDKLVEIAVPVILPTGGHAVYVDAGKMLPHIRWQEFPGQALSIALYTEGGIRAVEIGSVMEGKNKKAKRELLRLALPRRVYGKEHLDYVIDVFKELYLNRKNIRGVKFTYETPILRHFSSKFELI